MSSFAHYFNKHIAKKIELDDITIIDYYRSQGIWESWLQ